jgi:hypothetical protein
MRVVEADAIRQTVQHNCDISDARHAADAPLCVYLLRMRELYRWHVGAAATAPLDRRATADWIHQHERHWSAIEEQTYRPVVIGGARHDPFDDEAINHALDPLGLVYCAGLGSRGKPVFCLAELHRIEELDGCRLYVAGREIARELSSPPAMARGRSIHVRRESLRRVLWERVAEWQGSRRANAMSRALRWYDFDGDSGGALERMTDHELESVILHEIGEVVAGQLIGERWERMLEDVLGSPAEPVARAVRDNLADCVSALPAMLSQGDESSLHLYFASLSPYRRRLFPALAGAYDAWVAGDGLVPMKRVVRHGGRHWLDTAGHMLSAWQRGPAACAGEIADLAERHTL